MLIYKK